VLNGFMIFLTATFWPVRLSFAELRKRISMAINCSRSIELTRPDQTRPCRPVGDPSTCVEISFVFRKHGVAYTPPAPGPAYLEVISKVVPKICARTNSAMMRDCCPDCGCNIWTEVKGWRAGGKEEVWLVNGRSVRCRGGGKSLASNAETRR
jgi:hypothetical protein